jgi:hypothetical protein
MLNFLNYVFLLHLAFKPAKSIFEQLGSLQSNFRQLYDTPSSSWMNSSFIAIYPHKVK